MRLRLTLALDYPLGASRTRDALAVTLPAAGADGSVPPGVRLFVPGWLPCGECDRCRRGLGAVCAAGRPAWPPAEPLSGAAIDLPDRYLSPVDEPPGVTALGDEVAIAAGMVALVLQATATASVTAADECLWFGDDPLATLGATLTQARGCRTFALGDPQRFAAGGVTAASTLTALIEQRLVGVSDGAATSRHGGRQQRLFITRCEPALLSAAFSVAEPGTTFVLLGPGPIPLDGRLALPADARLAHVSLPHPDSIPEALAILRRGEIPSALLPASSLGAGATAAGYAVFSKPTAT